MSDIYNVGSDKKVGLEELMMMVVRGGVFSRGEGRKEYWIRE